MRPFKSFCCDSLEILDCAENSLEKLDLSNLQNLTFISAKENQLREINANSPKITYLDISKQFIDKNADVNIEQILNNPDNYSLDDLLKIGKKDIKGIDEELKDKLIKLVEEKSKKGKRNFSPEENKERQNQIQTSILNIKTY